MSVCNDMTPATATRESVRAVGPGIAGIPKPWPAFPGLRWCYHWHWRAPQQYAIPMLRSNVDPATVSIKIMMHNNNAAMLLNEPIHQENCNLECQVRFLHEHYGKIYHWNNDAQIIYWNGPYPSMKFMDMQLEMWERLYPHESFPPVDIGVHLYDKPAEVALRFARYVASIIPGASLIITECGSLRSQSEHEAAISTVVPELLSAGLAVAPFFWGIDRQYPFTSLGTNKHGLSRAGRLYASILSDMVEHP